MSSIIFSSDSEEYDSDEYVYDDDDETYNTNTSSEDDSFKSASYEEEDDNTVSSSKEHNNNNNLADHNLDSPSYEEDLAGSAEEENKADTAEEGYITREDKSTRKEDNTEDKMANNAGIYGRISQTIMGMPDNQIGDFIQSNATYSTDIILKMRMARRYFSNVRRVDDYPWDTRPQTFLESAHS
jgi:hypothetical protein